jgi:NAD binding domain of 6-phosphogluconate dehydrogenase
MNYFSSRTVQVLCVQSRSKYLYYPIVATCTTSTSCTTAVNRKGRVCHRNHNHKHYHQQHQQHHMCNYYLYSTSATKNSNMNVTSIGFIGLGNMGLPMVMNINKGIENETTTNDNNSNNNNNKKIKLFVYDVNPISRDVAAAKLSSSSSSSSLYVTNTIENILESIMIQKNNESTDRNHDVDDDNVAMIITMVPDCKAVDSVMTTIRDVICQQQQNNTTTTTTTSTGQSRARFIFVDCSTVHPTTNRRWTCIWWCFGCY